MTVENEGYKLTQGQFVHEVFSALESLRMYSPQIDYVLDEDGSIVVWLERDGEHCNFCDQEVEFRGGDWYSVSDGTTDCSKSGGHVVV
jgi:hypothetical protein